MKLWAHTLVRNEERYLWFAVMSVIDWVDKVLLWDTGSSDNTIKIIRELQKKYSSKVEFKEIGEVSPEEYTKARQAMLEKTNSDWFLVLDGDEVWWEDSIKKATDVLRKEGEELDSIVVPMVYPIGDIYHYQEEAAGKYEIDGRVGHFAVKFINRRIPGLYTSKPHGQHGYYDANNILIQERSSQKRKFVNAPFMHFTHMIRSSGLKEDRRVPKRDLKFKYELGKKFPLDFYFPEVLFKERPSFIPSPWQRMSKNYFFKAFWQSPLRKIKRRVFRGKVGY